MNWNEKLGEVDWEGWVQARFQVLNGSGRDRYEEGLRRINCPFCGDDRGRGWVNVSTFGVGCWNGGCPAEYRATDMWILEYARRVEGLPSMGRALRYLREAFPAGSSVTSIPTFSDYLDYCHIPEGTQPIQKHSPSVLQQEAVQFLSQQWGLPIEEVEGWGLRFGTRGRYAWRVIVPIVMGARVVGFTARSYRGGEPKYLNAKVGSECGRPVEAMVFNIDGIDPDVPVILMEGVGDVMGWEKHVKTCPTCATYPSCSLLGKTISDEKIALLHQTRVRQIVVALDADTGLASDDLAQRLRAWGFSVAVGNWVGGKDAGSGAHLHLRSLHSLEARLQQLKQV